MNDLGKFILSKEMLAEGNDISEYLAVADPGIIAVKCSWENHGQSIIQFDACDYYSMIILYEGSRLDYIFNHKRRRLASGKMYIFNGNTEYEIIAGLNENYTLMQILMPADYTDRVISNLFGMKLNEIMRQIDIQDKIMMQDINETVVSDALNKIENILEVKDSAKKIKIKTRALIIIITAAAKLITRFAAKQYGGKFTIGSWIPERLLNRYQIVGKVIGYIDKHLNDDLSLKRLSLFAAVSPPHLCVLFKMTVGMTIGEYINEARMESGCELLDSADNVTDVAINIGFNEISYFSSKFKKAYGITPTCYKNRKNN